LIIFLEKTPLRMKFLPHEVALFNNIVLIETTFPLGYSFKIKEAIFNGSLTTPWFILHSGRSISIMGN
jgi:hypothetical protein